MTWLQYLSFLAAITGVRWVLNEMTPHGDDYLFGGIIIGCLAWIIYQRFRAHALLDLWVRSSDADREALRPALMDAVGLRPRLPVPVNPEDRLTFRYPSASLRELAAKCRPPTTKAAAHRRLSRLILLGSAD